MTDDCLQPNPPRPAFSAEFPVPLLAILVRVRATKSQAVAHRGLAS